MLLFHRVQMLLKAWQRTETTNPESSVSVLHVPICKHLQQYTIQLFSKRTNWRNNMINVTTLMRYISIVSFIDILVTNNHYSQRNHYGTVIIYITQSDPVVCEVSDHIVQALSS